MKKIISTLIFCGISVLLLGQVDRTIDGFGNNYLHPEWGSTGAILPQWVSNGFQDSIGEPAGSFRPNPRLISNQLFNQDSMVENDHNLSEFVWAFGQFIDHDISKVAQHPGDRIDIKIPSNDEYFKPGSSMPFFRSRQVTGSGLDLSYPRRYENEITSFIDASVIYGSNETRANWLRTFENGKLKTSSGNLLPWNTIDNEFNSPVDLSAPSMDNDLGRATKWFVSGDVRANEHPVLIALHTLFMREHNRICDSLKQRYPNWEDELLYQKARKTVGALIQSVVYNEWLPTIGVNIDPRQAYDPTVDATISNVFSAAAFRLGHTMINDELMRYDFNRDTLYEQNLPIREAFFNPNQILLSNGIESFLFGLTYSLQQAVDIKVVNGLRNFLFGEPGLGGMDLAAMNIMRGRDRGLPDYQRIRSDLGLSVPENFEALTEDEDLIYQMKFLYGKIEHVDPWVGMLIEKPVDGSILGELLYTIVRHQFKVLLVGDRFYFENDPSFTDMEKKEIRNTRLSDIILSNTPIKELRENVFLYIVDPVIEEGPELVPKTLDAVAYPIPANQFVKISYYLEEKGSLTTSLIDIFGHRFIERKLDGIQGTNFYTLFLNEDIPPGQYLLTLEKGQAYKHFKLRIH